MVLIWKTLQISAQTSVVDTTIKRRVSSPFINHLRHPRKISLILLPKASGELPSQMLPRPKMRSLAPTQLAIARHNKPSHSWESLDLLLRTPVYSDHQEFPFYKHRRPYPKKITTAFHGTRLGVRSRHHHIRLPVSSTHER